MKCMHISSVLGVCEIEEGTFTENEIKIESTSLGRLTFGSDPETKKVHICTLVL